MNSFLVSRLRTGGEYWPWEETYPTSLTWTNSGGTNESTLQGDGCTALVMATMLDKTAVVKVLVAAHAARGIGVDQRTVRRLLPIVVLVSLLERIYIDNIRVMLTTDFSSLTNQHGPPNLLNNSTQILAVSS